MEESYIKNIVCALRELKAVQVQFVLPCRCPPPATARQLRLEGGRVDLCTAVRTDGTKEDSKGLCEALRREGMEVES